LAYILTHAGSGPNAGRYVFDGNGTSRYNIEAVAHALSQLCRFTGHTKVFYSVSEHCCHVHDLLEPELQIQGLLHDAHEAFVGDVSSPLKMLLPDYKLVERRAEHSLRRKFGLPDLLHPDVKEADLIMLATERRDLIDLDPHAWQILDGIDPLPWRLLSWYRRPWSPARAKREFLKRFQQHRGV